jgi:hypothetical protein
MEIDPKFASSTSEASATTSVSPVASSQPENSNISTDLRSPPAINFASPLLVRNFSWDDAEIRLDVVRTKLDLARISNFVFLGVFVFLTVAAIVQGNAVLIDKAWSLLCLWVGAMIGWVLRDHKDPKPHDRE